MFKCESCKDTGMVTLFSFSKPCLDCPPPEYPEYDELVEIIESNREEILAKCNDCGWVVSVLPGTFGYDDLIDNRDFRAKCGGCGQGGRIFKLQIVVK